MDPDDRSQQDLKKFALPWDYGSRLDGTYYVFDSMGLVVVDDTSLDWAAFITRSVNKRQQGNAPSPEDRSHCKTDGWRNW